MGIFSFLNRDRDYENIDIVPVEPVEEPGPKLPNLTKGMSLDIVNEDGKFLNSGLISQRKDREVTLERHPGSLSFKLCEPGSTVFVRGCDSNLVQFYLRATVEESTRILMRVKDLEPAVQNSQRESFRLEINAPISICYLNDERFEHPETCTLADISTGGCCFASEYLHGEGEVLRLRIKLGDYAAMDFVGEVIRVQDCGKDGFRCGVLFAQLKPEETEALTKMLYNIQTGNRREHSRSEAGHW